PGHVGRLAVAFFEGAGFAYAHVISVIITAIMFAESIRANGLIDRLAAPLHGSPAALTVASVVIPWIAACVTGTAVGTAPVVLKILVPLTMGTAGKATTLPSNDAALFSGLRIGSLTAITAQFGRTSSPVAPVAIMCATLSRTRPIDLVKRVAPPMIAGAIA